MGQHAALPYRVLGGAAQPHTENRLPRGWDWPIFRAVARVAQLDRASASGAEGCGFDPRLAHQSSLATKVVASEDCRAEVKRRRAMRLDNSCCELRLGAPEGLAGFLDNTAALALQIS